MDGVCVCVYGRDRPLGWRGVVVVLCPSPPPYNFHDTMTTIPHRRYRPPTPFDWEAAAADVKGRRTKCFLEVSVDKYVCVWCVCVVCVYWIYMYGVCVCAASVEEVQVFCGRDEMGR
jgi:hypothetical protein